MWDNRTSGVASVGTGCRCFDHAAREVEMLQKLESLTEGCDRLVDRVSAFER